MSEVPRTTVVVEIGGEDYTIRADATPDYTKRCAEYVDGAVRDIVDQSSMVEAHKAVILAALSITDQLFQARAETDTLRREMGRLARSLSERIEGRLDGGDLAPAS